MCFRQCHCIKKGSNLGFIFLWFLNIFEILIIPWEKDSSTNSKDSTVLSWCPYPIHHSLLLFPLSKASLSFLEISWASNASSSPLPLCDRAEHHQGHPESLQENIFQSTQSATSGLVIDQARLPEAPVRQGSWLLILQPSLVLIPPAYQGTGPGPSQTGLPH